MINLDVDREGLKKTIRLLKKRDIVIPTFEQMIDPEKNDVKVMKKLNDIALWDVHPANLFRINWKNQPVEKGGQYGEVNFLEIPPALSGVPARIIGLVGKWFPTGAHKVGASFGCLVPRLVTGQFQPDIHKAVWPSTGNYCRGGAYNSALLGCDSVAILPEEMSRERFEWLENIAGEIIATPGSESNVKEIYDKCRELRETRDNVIIFNQFDEFGNYLWHYAVTGRAIEEVFQKNKAEGQRLSAFVSSTGSAGTIAAGDYLKQNFPCSKIVATEALQCPTLLQNGFGEHRIEGIGDKHVPWIHNVRNTDFVVAVDDQFCMNLVRLFNEPPGKDYLRNAGVKETVVDNLSLLGISGISNLISSVKYAKYHELNDKDCVFTIFTDSMDLYGSRLKELEKQYGVYTREDAVKDYHAYLKGIATDHMLELSYRSRKRIHNLKYFTWIEQQGKKVSELNAQWYDFPDYWTSIQKQVKEIDILINEFNSEVTKND